MARSSLQRNGARLGGNQNGVPRSSRQSCPGPCHSDMARDQPGQRSTCLGKVFFSSKAQGVSPCGNGSIDPGGFHFRMRPIVRSSISRLIERVLCYKGDNSFHCIQLVVAGCPGKGAVDYFLFFTYVSAQEKLSARTSSTDSRAEYPWLSNGSITSRAVPPVPLRA